MRESTTRIHPTNWKAGEDVANHQLGLLGTQMRFICLKIITPAAAIGMCLLDESINNVWPPGNLEFHEW